MVTERLRLRTPYDVIDPRGSQRQLVPAYGRCELRGPLAEPSYLLRSLGPLLRRLYVARCQQLRTHVAAHKLWP